MKKRPFAEKRARALRDRDFHVLALGYYLWESPSAQTVRIAVFGFDFVMNGCKNALLG